MFKRSRYKYLIALVFLVALTIGLFFQFHTANSNSLFNASDKQQSVSKSHTPAIRPSVIDSSTREPLRPQIAKGRRDIKAPELPKENLSDVIASWSSKPTSEISPGLVAQIAYATSVCERYSPQNPAEPQQAKLTQHRKVVSAEGPMPADLALICKNLSADLIVQAEDRLKEAARAGNETAMRQFVGVDSFSILRDVDAFNDPANAKQIASIQEEQFKYAKILADSGDIRILSWVSMLYETGSGTPENLAAAYAYKYAANRALANEEFLRINAFSPEVMLKALADKLDYPSLVSAQQEGERLFRECCSVPAK